MTFKNEFNTLKNLLEKHSKGLVLREGVVNTTSRGDKLGFHLYGKKDVTILNRKAQPTYLAGIIQQKNFVGFYFMPIYAFPKEFSLQNEGLKKALKGKSCFHITKVTPEMLEEMDAMLKKGVELFKREKWI